jgi:hypothetical protein
VLESVLVGPVNVGNYRFVFQVLFTVKRARSYFLPFKLSYLSCFNVKVLRLVASSFSFSVARLDLRFFLLE